MDSIIAIEAHDITNQARNVTFYMDNLRNYTLDEPCHGDDGIVMVYVTYIRENWHKNLTVYVRLFTNSPPWKYNISHAYFTSRWHLFVMYCQFFYSRTMNIMMNEFLLLITYPWKLHYLFFVCYISYTVCKLCAR